MKLQTRFQRFPELKNLFDPDENFTSNIIVLLTPEPVDKLDKPIDRIEECVQQDCFLLGL